VFLPTDRALVRHVRQGLVALSVIDIAPGCFYIVWYIRRARGQGTKVKLYDPSDRDATLVTK